MLISIWDSAFDIAPPRVPMPLHLKFQRLFLQPIQELPKLTINKALILKYAFKVQLCYHKLGDTESPLNPAGPQLLHLQSESVAICDFSGTVQALPFCLS